MRVRSSDRKDWTDPGQPPAVLVMARAPRRGEVRRALEPEIGVSASMALHTALLVGAVEWARTVSADAVYVAHEPADASSGMRTLLGTGVHLFPQNGEGITGRVADAVARVYAKHPGPTLIVWPDLVRLTESHAAAALSDLRAGADVVIGPAFDGGFYLIGVNRPLGALFGLPESAWRGADSMAMVLRAAVQAGLDVGLLRTERALHRPADVRALLADPMLPEGVARVLRRR